MDTDMLIFILLHIIILADLYSSHSIKNDIKLAKKIVKDQGMPDLNFCEAKHKSTLCKNLTVTLKICGTRLVRKRFEFKEFDSPCHMDLYNFCESRDNIWVIKHAGDCKMNHYLRRYAKDDAIPDNDEKSNKTAESHDKKSNDESDCPEGDTSESETEATSVAPVTTTETKPDLGRVTLAGDAVEDEDHEWTSDENDELAADEKPKDVAGEAASDGTKEASGTADEAKDVEKSPAGDTVGGNETTVASNKNPSKAPAKTALRTGKAGNIRKVGGNKTIVAANAPSKPSLRIRKKAFCDRKNKFCGPIYNPVCLYYEKENPEKVTYYEFSNTCEALRFQCLNPQVKISDQATLRSGFCSHIRFINYGRFIHTISAWGHYGWLHGPGPFHRILKPNERAS